MLAKLSLPKKPHRMHKVKIETETEYFIPYLPERITTQGVILRLIK